MRKSALLALTLVSALTGIFLLSRDAQARMIGTNPTGTQADQFCVGGRVESNVVVSTSEVCLDGVGNWVPTGTGSQQLGTGSLQYSDVESTGINTSGKNLTEGAAGTSFVQASASTAAASNIINLGLTSWTSVAVGTGSQNTPATLVTGSTIPVSASFETIISSGAPGAVELTSQPTIATTTILGGLGVNIPDGTFLILTSTTTGATGGVTLIDNGTLSGTKLRLGSTKRTITAQKTIMLIFSSVDGFWREVSFANN